MLYPCPACGFEVFKEPIGSYDICPVCGWEDDNVQLRFPDMQGGANGGCLYEWQLETLLFLPLETKATRGFRHDPSWRPLTVDEAKSLGEIPKSGVDYFRAVDVDIPDYYWRK